MKTIKDLKINAGRYSQLKIEVNYTLGGMNYFSGNVNKRGYKLYLTPCDCHADGFMSQTLLGADEHESGFYILLEEVTRMNQKRLKYWQDKIEPLADEIADLYSEKRYDDIIELVGGQNPNPEKAENSTKKLLDDKLLNDLKNEVEDHFIVKFFNPSGTWYVKDVQEYIMKKDGHEIVVHDYEEMVKNKGEGWEVEDIVFFGYVKLLYAEYGYFNLKQLESIDKPMMWVERDKHFTATKCELIID